MHFLTHELARRRRRGAAAPQVTLCLVSRCSLWHVALQSGPLHPAFPAYGAQTVRLTVACPFRAFATHATSVGHSAAFEVVVHWRTQNPPLPNDGT